MKSAAKIILLPFILGFAQCCVFAQQKDVFSQKQAEYIDCAMERLFVLNAFFDMTRPFESKKVSAACLSAKEIAPPAWLKDKLSEMERYKGWQVTLDNGAREVFSEAEIWRRVFEKLYMTLQLAMQVNSGSDLTPRQNITQFGQIRVNFLIDLDRLNINPDVIAHNVRDSMDGRGRGFLATLKLINSEMDGVAEAWLSPIGQGDIKFRRSILAIAVLSNSLFSDLLESPAPVMPQEAKPGRSNIVLVVLLQMLGTMAVFFGVFKFLSDKDEKINIAVRRYIQKSSSWADDYSRQFLDIDVKYIVFGTLGIFIVAGSLFGLGIGGFMGFVVFIFCFLAGLYISLKMPAVFLGILKRRRGAKVNAQLMDALILLSNSLKSGMDIVQGFELVSHDLRPPISDEFGLIVKNYKLGSPFETALEGMEERVESRLLSYMIKAIILQRQVGGNLTKIFDRIVESIREESKLEEKLQAMTAQQRIQAIVVGIMPWIMVGVMFMFQPDTMIAFYTKPVGLGVLLFCIIWIFLGIKMVNKMGDIKV
ncbi:MAG: type II secretion system F family protein [Elusimicrobiota bacterium]|jgi:tight adherence protein B|nr:type II secretion system F family protein [Elusimicrobiota bacterium]